MNKILRSIHLLVQSPKDYLYSYTYSNSQRVSIKPFDPKVLVTARKIIAKIHKTCPKVKVYFIGSSRLKIPGKNDIDMFISCSQSNLNENQQKLTKAFGLPNKAKNKFLEWNFVKDGFEVELVLIDDKTKRFQEQLKIYNTLKNNRKILEEYIQLKLNLDGKSQREYTQTRMEFFNRLLVN